MVGRTVVGRFRVERIIGRGGMASVYAAVDERSGQEVALKLLKRELTRDPTVLRRFEREAKAASHLVHPNIIRVFESGIQDEDAFIAMELASGKDLLKALSQERPMRQARAALILAQVCSALDVAHGKGIVHRDLKPENIVLVADPDEPGGERAKVLDFGIAKILDVSKPGNASDATDPPSYVTKTALTRVGTIVGTPAYMSPEQCRGGDLDGRSDIYTCGVLLYQLVTGELPFTGETPLHTAMRHIHAQPRPPHELRRDINAGLERIILKALAKWPGERHQTAQQLREELAAVIPDLPDRGEVVLPHDYLQRVPAAAAAPAAAAKPAAPPVESATDPSPDSEPVQPTRMLVGGPLGRTPLRAVRLGGPASSPPSKPPADPPPSTPTPTADDDDEPRTFLMSGPSPSAWADTSGSPADTKSKAEGVASKLQPPRTEARVEAPRSGAPSTSAGPASPKPSARPPSGEAKANSPLAHAKTAPSGGPLAPGPIPRAPARPERGPRPPTVPLRAGAVSPSARPTAPTPASPPADKPAQSVTMETGLTPTALTHVPSSNDPPTRKKAESAETQASRAGPAPASSLPQTDPLGHTSPAAGHPPSLRRQVLSSRPPPAPPAPERGPAVDDDEVSTGVRDVPPEKRGANQTLVMEEPAKGAPASQQAPRAHAMAVGPTLLANQAAPTGPEIEAEALRALKATTRMAIDDPTTSAGAARAGTLRMSQQQAEQRYSAPPPSVQVNPAYAGAAAQPPPSTRVPNLAPLTGHSGWNEATVSRRRLETSPPAPRGGLVGELASLPGTTGFLIGIGLGLGIAAGVVIALLVMR